MANSAFQIVPRWPSISTGIIVIGLTVGTLGAVAWRADFSTGLSPADLAAIRFTVSQAFVSAVISVALAIPLARALARRSFAGRRLLITLMGAPFVLPVIVAVFGLLAIFGRSGIINQALEAAQLTTFSIYGFHGVVLAHVFFNLPLATRLLLQGWMAIPAERFRLAASLGLPVWRFLERPMLRSVIPGTFLVVFLICLTSFAVALTLGGGPKATTVELAIYQALRFDFDLGRAALLAAVQFVLCAVAAILVISVSRNTNLSGGLDRTISHHAIPSAWIDYLVIAAAALFLVLPLSAVIIRGLPGLFELPASIWIAAMRSIMIALTVSLLCICAATALATYQSSLLSVVGVLPLAASSLVIGTGAFLLIYPLANPAKVAIPITILVNAVLALPFVLRAIAPAVADAQRDFGRLGASLGFSPFAWLFIVLLPRIKRPLGFGAGLAAALSMGDLGVITLFATGQQDTLPLAMYRLMGSYQTEAAASAGLVLLALSLLLFWLCDRGGRVHAPLS